MMTGKFGEIGQLLFEIEVIAADEERLSTDVLLDTGFTSGLLAMNSQDIEALEWRLVQRNRVMRTARGEETFDIYDGKVLLDGEEFSIEVVAGDELQEPLLGLPWLQILRLVVDFSAGVLTLGESGGR